MRVLSYVLVLLLSAFHLSAQTNSYQALRTAEVLQLDQWELATFLGDESHLYRFQARENGYYSVSVRQVSGSHSADVEAWHSPLPEGRPVENGRAYLRAEEILTLRATGGSSRFDTAIRFRIELEEDRPSEDHYSSPQNIGSQTGTIALASDRGSYVTEDIGPHNSRWLLWTAPTDQTYLFTTDSSFARFELFVPGTLEPLTDSAVDRTLLDLAEGTQILIGFSGSQLDITGLLKPGSASSPVHLSATDTPSLFAVPRHGFDPTLAEFGITARAAWFRYTADSDQSIVLGLTDSSESFHFHTFSELNGRPSRHLSSATSGLRHQLFTLQAGDSLLIAASASGASLPEEVGRIFVAPGSLRAQPRHDSLQDALIVAQTSVEYPTAEAGGDYSEYSFDLDDFASSDGPSNFGTLWARWTADFSGPARLYHDARSAAVLNSDLVTQPEQSGSNGITGFSAVLGETYFFSLRIRSPHVDIGLSVHPAPVLSSPETIAASSTRAEGSLYLPLLTEHPAYLLENRFDPFFGLSKSSAGFSEYIWTAPTDGLWEFSTFLGGPGKRPSLQIASELNGGEFLPVVEESLRASQLLQATAGTSYHILLVGNRFESSGAGFAWTQVPSPINTSLEAAAPVESGQAMNSTLAGHLPSKAGVRRAYFTWTPDRVGPHRISFSAPESLSVEVSDPGSDQPFQLFSGEEVVWIDSLEPRSVVVLRGNEHLADVTLDFQLTFTPYQAEPGAFPITPKQIEGEGTGLSVSGWFPLPHDSIRSGRGLFCSWTAPRSGTFKFSSWRSALDLYRQDPTGALSRFPDVVSLQEGDTVVLQLKRIGAFHNDGTEDTSVNIESLEGVSAAPVLTLPDEDSFKVPITSIPGSTRLQQVVRFSITEEQVIELNAGDRFEVVELIRLSAGQNQLLLASISSSSGSVFVQLPVGEYQFLLQGDHHVSFTELSGLRRPVSAGDDFRRPIDLGSTLGSHQHLETRGSVQLNEPDYAYSRGMWFRWEAPNSGVFDFSGASAFEDLGHRPGDRYLNSDFSDARLHLQEGESVLLNIWTPDTRNTPTEVVFIREIKRLENNDPSRSVPLVPNAEGRFVVNVESTLPTDLSSQLTSQNPSGTSLPLVGWFTFTATHAGIHGFDLPSGNQLTLFTRASEGTYRKVGSHSYSAKLQAILHPGEQVWLAVGRSTRERITEAEITVTTPEAGGTFAANDDFENATEISFDGTSFSQILEAGELASPEVDEPIYSSLGATRWWKFTAPQDGLVEIPDQLLRGELFTGTELSDLEKIEQEEFRDFFSSIRRYFYTVAAGENYYLRINTTSTFQPNSEKELLIRLITNNTRLEDASSVRLNTETTFDFRAPLEARSQNTPDLFFKLDVVNEATAIAVSVNNDHTLILLRNGEPVGEIRHPNNSELIFLAEPEHEYHLQIEKRFFDHHTGTLVLRPFTTVEHDLRSEALVLNGTSSSGHPVVLGPATLSAAEGGSSDDQSVWTSFTAQAAGNYRFQTSGNRLSIAVYRVGVDVETTRSDTVLTYLDQGERVDIVVYSDRTSGRRTANLSISSETIGGDDLANATNIGIAEEAEIRTSLRGAGVSADELEGNEIETADWASLWWEWTPRGRNGFVEVSHSGPGELEQTLIVVRVDDAGNATPLSGAAANGLSGQRLSASFTTFGGRYFIRYAAPKKFSNDFSVRFHSPSTSTLHGEISKASLDGDEDFFAQLTTRSPRSSSERIIQSVARLIQLTDSSVLPQFLSSFSDLPRVGRIPELAPIFIYDDSQLDLHNMTPGEFSAYVNLHLRDDLESLLLSSEVLGGDYEDQFATSEFGYSLYMDRVDALGIYLTAASILGVADFCDGLESEARLGDLLAIDWTPSAFLSRISSNLPPLTWPKFGEDKRIAIRELFDPIFDHAEQIALSYSEGAISSDRSQHLFRYTPEQLRSIVNDLRLLTGAPDSSFVRFLGLTSGTAQLRATELDEQGRIFAFSLPDPSLGGIFPSRSQTDWSLDLRDAGLLANPTSYQDWANSITWDSPGTDRLKSADPDGDGRVNWLEYAFVSNPLHADPADQPVVIDGPQDQIVINTRLVPTDIDYTLQRWDGQSWVPHGLTTRPRPPSPRSSKLAAEGPLGRSNRSGAIFRLKAEDSSQE